MAKMPWDFLSPEAFSRGYAVSQPQWRRFLPEGKHLILVLVLGFLVLAGVVFASLSQMRLEAEAAQASAAAQVQQLQGQKAQLEDTLDHVERGDNLEADARRYFNVARPGDKVIVGQAPEQDSSAPEVRGEEPSAPPYWQQWLDRLLGR
jgi:cell division protein FtsB